MKITTFTLLTIIFLSLNINSQWFPQYVTVADMFISIEFADTLNGVVSGYTSGTGGICKYTTDGGTTWINSNNNNTAGADGIKSLQYISGGIYLAAVQAAFPSDKTGFYSSSSDMLFSREYLDFQKNNNYSDFMYTGKLCKSTDGGQSWSFHGGYIFGVTNFNSIYFLNENTGYAAGNDSGLFGKYAILKTTDGGSNFVKLTMPHYIGNMTSVYFKDQNTGFAAGRSVLPTYPLPDIWYASIFRTTDGGVSWNQQVFKPVWEYKSIKFINNLTGFCVGHKWDTTGAVYKTTDAGLTWNSIYSSPGTFLIRSFDFIPGTGTGVFFGNNNQGFINILKTTDYGATWDSEQSLFYPGYIVQDGNLLNPNKWFICGGNVNYTDTSLILKTTNGGFVGFGNINNQNAEAFLLSQNYPNPFNPSTNIEYRIQTQTFVRLVVYDISGRLAAVLVNKNQNKGNYYVQFDAKNFSSGVYFYKLDAGDFSGIKKMIFIK